MCGISAIVAREPGLLPDGAARRMAAALRHRGPDAFTDWSAERCSFGHVRLSIIDLTTGAQPMSDAEGRFAITFNGEIYNYREVRDELRALGHEFRTSSDTEVLLAGYRQWGAGLLDRLRGMFAFAIWDARDRTLFAARDLFGEKPLYHSLAPDGTLFLASEIKALLASGSIAGELDRESVDAYLATGYVPPDRTIYRNVAILPPAHLLLWRDGVVEVKPWWTPRMETRAITMADAVEEMRFVVDRAVERQMVADVPVGAFLSGGLDSSTIVALMQQHSSHRIKTFSVGFGNLINELPYARAVAERYGTEHHEIDLGIPDVPRLLEKMAAVYDEPFADSSSIPTYLVSEFARRDVKVVLSGDGGDELFGGYAWYTNIQHADSVRGGLLRWIALRGASVALRHRWKGLEAHSHALGLHLRWPDPWAATIASHMSMRSKARRRLWQGEAPAGELDRWPYYRPDDRVRGLNRSFHFDLLSYLPGDILTKVDRAAMAHGLETRAPFLDRDVAELALSLPERLKVDGSRTKAVMREAFEPLWPASLHDRPKMGFGAPYTHWLANPEVAAMARAIAKPGGRLRTLLPGVTEADLANRDYAAWTLLTLGLWLDHWKVSV